MQKFTTGLELDWEWGNWSCHWDIYFANMTSSHFLKTMLL